ncbi:MAG: hypothetical protein J6J97_05870 [Akkermansia sp.]|nr:hypothetical protein [Akkermansia sp.]
MAKKDTSSIFWYLKILLSQQTFFTNANDAEGMAGLMLAFYCIRTAPNGGKVENPRELLEDKRTARTHGFKSQHRKLLLSTPSVPGLWHWEGSTLISDLYPVAEETAQLCRSAGGTKSAESRKLAKEQQETENYSPTVHLNEY